MKLDGIYFIVNNVEFESEALPFHFSDEFILRAATEYEIIEFKKVLLTSHGSTFMKFPLHYETELEDIPEDGSNSHEYVLSEKQRYWVISFEAPNHFIELLMNVGMLIRPKLYCGYGMLSKDGEVGVTMGEDVSLINKFRYKESKTITTKELMKLKDYFNLLLADNKSNDIIKTPLKMYRETSMLSIHSGILTLSLFSIIESLITHKPRLSETLDSINHQIKNKINLLSKRFDLSIEHISYFGEIDFLKLLGKLYALRSDIAHGQSYLFDNGEYQILKSLENTNNFLDEIVRELIKLSMDDPTLIKDIKAC